jgi:hypothetical protein
MTLFDTSLSGLETFGTVQAVAGMLTKSIGGFYQAKTQQFELKTQAAHFDFAAGVADINARASDRDASLILRAGRREKAIATLRHGALKAGERVDVAARGVDVSSASAAELLATREIAKDLDALAIDENAHRATSAARRRAVDFRNEALFARVSAQNLRRSAGTIIPGLQAATSLIGGAGQVAGMFARNRRFDALFAER